MIEQFIIENTWIIYVAVLWVLPWKGIALWRASKNNHRNWFIFILVLNTLAILEIIYIFFFSKRKKTNFIQRIAKTLRR